MGLDLRGRFLRHYRQLFAQVNLKQTVVVAVSTGSDSMTLLHLLRTLPPQLAPKQLVVAYFDHNLRAESAKETAFIRDYCMHQHLPLVWARWQQPQSSEAAARTARYQFLRAAAQATGAAVVMTAHHADDQTETMLQKLTRGGWLGQLVGIKAVRPLNTGAATGAFTLYLAGIQPSDSAAALHLVRPLLPFAKNDLRTYAHAHALPFFDDATNASDRYWRNQLRHHVVPQLKAHNPQLNVALRAYQQQLADVLAVAMPQIEATLKQLQLSPTTFKRRELLTLPASYQRLVLHQFLAQFTDKVASRQLQAVANCWRRPGAQVRLRADLWLVATPNVVRVQPVPPVAAKAQRKHQTSLWLSPTIPQLVALAPLNLPDGGTIMVEKTNNPPAHATKNQLILPAAVAEKVRLRTWQAGDRLVRARGHEKIKKILNAAKIPLQQRRNVVVAAFVSSPNVYAALGVKYSDLSARRQNAKMHYIITYLPAHVND